MLRHYTKDECALSWLDGKTIAVIGYGNQGHAHALNLNDTIARERQSFMECPKVIVGTREASPTRTQAIKDGLDVFDSSSAAKQADIIAMMIPDEKMGDVYATDIEPNLKKGDTLLFAHGFAIRFKLVLPPDDIDVVMVAPKGPGTKLRASFLQGGGLKSLIAVEQDMSGNARDGALSYALGIGCAKYGIIESTFAEETETDLFGEQAVLCGGVSQLMMAGFQTLLDAGFEPEMAYYECITELKLTVDLMIEGGLEYMNRSISNTAEFGEYWAEGRIIGQDSKTAMRKILQEVRDGSFARAFMESVKNGDDSYLKRKREEISHSDIAHVGAKVREDS